MATACLLRPACRHVEPLHRAHSVAAPPFRCGHAGLDDCIGRAEEQQATSDDGRRDQRRLRMAEAGATAARPTMGSYWRSSCSHRVRIALNLKGVDYEYKAVNLLKGEQSDPEFIKLNPMKFVPAFVDGDAVIGDSYAIALYLEDRYPERPLLPQDLKMKALNTQIASIVCSGIQPLHNLTLLCVVTRCARSKFVHHPSSSSLSYKRMLPFLMDNNDISSQEQARCKIRRVSLEEEQIVSDEKEGHEEEQIASVSRGGSSSGWQ